MRFPWRRRAEARQSVTEDRIAAQIARAGGEVPVVPEAVAALECAAGLVARAFASAEVSGPASVVAALQPALLGLVGRALIVRGELVARVHVDETGRLAIIPAAGHDVTGSWDRSTWRYAIDQAGPSSTTTIRGIGSADVLHVRYSYDAATPWRGLGPIQRAAASGRLSAQVVAALSQEASMPVGRFIPVPVDGEDDSIADFKADLKRGGLLTLETGDWGQAGAGGGVATGRTERYGPEPPAPAVDLGRRAFAEILAACGIAESLFFTVGADSRESWRQALFGVIHPLARLLEEELERVFGAVRLGFRELRASDLQARTRSFKQMVESGLAMDEARRIAGIQ